MSTEIKEKIELPVSKMAEQLVGSEIIKLAGEVKKLIAEGSKIHNFTIGDFNPQIFPIPAELKNLIIDAYHDNHTNYPAANGMQELRDSVSKYIKDKQGLDYSSEEYLIAGGARPLIYACFQALVDPGEAVLFPVPSWNNNHYTHLSHAEKVMIKISAEQNFMPVAGDFEPYIEKASLIALCSPLNPTGTVFSEVQLRSICELIIKENKRRGPGAKPVYLMYDQIYWQLCYGDNKHLDPVSLYPELRDYTIYIDGVSKVFAATGIRVGWAFGPQKVINKMKAILGHVGAWAPKAEQMATAKFLDNRTYVDSYLEHIKSELFERLSYLYNGMLEMKNEGLPIDVIPPQAALYLTLRLPLVGATKANGDKIENTEQITEYILKDAGIALVPFYSFGTDRDSTWYRLSVGTCEKEDLPEVLNNLKNALSELSF